MTCSRDQDEKFVRACKYVAEHPFEITPKFIEDNFPEEESFIVDEIPWVWWVWFFRTATIPE